MTAAGSTLSRETEWTATFCRAINVCFLVARQVVMSAVSRSEIVLLLMAFIVGLDLAARRLQLPRAAALIFGKIASR